MGTSHEDRKARMRAYYRANKDKWRKYNRDSVANLSDKEKESRREKHRQYDRAYYRANRERIIERTSQYQKKNREWSAAYRAEWYQKNKGKVAARRRHHYHTVVKQRQKADKEASEFLTVREAATLLGAKLRTFREWVYRGRIPAVKTPGGRWLLHRGVVEEIQANICHLPNDIRKRLGLAEKGEME